MDGRTRWETEALRSGPSGRPSPPRPTAKRGSPAKPDDRPWVTLREAESATGIPVNTLRKWIRRAGLPSYLESDGDTPVRMVDLDAVRQRADELGRDLAPVPDTSPESRVSSLEAEEGIATTREPELEARSSQLGAPLETRDSGLETPDTMIVPVDAWNKMLAQLGNLHEAGQQLAEARERAAKAETEAEFLRRRLAELREGAPDPAPDPEIEPSTMEVAAAPEEDGATTTSFLHYVASGWRKRRKR